MNCTLCETGKLSPSFIEGEFRAQTCTECEGNWILIEDFLGWKERNPDYQFAKDIAFDSDINDTKKAILCPATGNIMMKFRISSANQHRLDYSAAAGGLWLDKGEWELLKEEGLASSLHLVISTKWQTEIRDNTTAENFSYFYKDKFGEENYAKVKEFKTWLDKHPQKADLRAYIFAEDPYSAKK